MMEAYVASLRPPENEISRSEATSVVASRVASHRSAPLLVSLLVAPLLVSLLLALLLALLGRSSRCYHSLL